MLSRRFVRLFRAGYPAPGWRHNGDGTLWYVGDHGASWASSISGNRGHYLRFINVELTPKYTYHRSAGFQVRCLQE